MSDVNTHNRTRAAVAVLVGQIAGVMLAADWTVESIVRNAEALVTEMERRDRIAFERNIGLGPNPGSKLTAEERDMLDNGQRVRGVQTIKARLQIPLKEAYDLAAEYRPAIRQTNF